MSPRRDRAWLPLALAAIAGSAGCSSEAETFRLRLTYAQDGAQACPRPDGAPATCAAITMRCSVRFLVRITDATGTETLYSSCRTLERVGDACALSELPLEASAPLVNGMSRIQVAVWPEDQLTPHEASDAAPGDPDALVPGACPEDVRFARGQPMLAVDDEDAWKVPALGGEIFFPIGDRRVAEVELGCPRYDQLDTATCRNAAPEIRANLRDLLSWTLLPPSEQVDVWFGEPMLSVDETWTLNLADRVPLMPSGGSQGDWTGRLARVAPPFGCVVVRELAASTVPIATCDEVTVVNGMTSLDGYLVVKDRVNRLRRVIGLSEFPSSGMVLGVVLGDNNTGVAGVRITSPVEVAYPTEDFEQVGLNETSANGTFISTSAPFETAWAATGPGGLVDDGTARGGLVAEHLTVVVVRMRQSSGGQ